MFGYFRERRRARLRQQPFPDAGRAVLRERLQLYPGLGEERVQRLEGLVQVFLAEKQFEGCGGLSVTDEMRVTIAAHACVLLLGRESGFYPGLRSVLIYPDVFVAPQERLDEAGFVEEVDEIQEGESWNIGALVLSWKDILRDTRVANGRNVIYHEFAHQLYEDHDFGFDSHEASERWQQLVDQEFQEHVAAVEQDRKTFFDPYGAEDEGEFFSVITEHFFEQPAAFRARHEALYDQLVALYRQDPREYYPA